MFHFKSYKQLNDGEILLHTPIAHSTHTLYEIVYDECILTSV